MSDQPPQGPPPGYQPPNYPPPGPPPQEVPPGYPPPSQQPPGYPPYGQQPPPVPGGAPQRPKRTGLVIVLSVLAVMVLIGGVTGAFLLLRSDAAGASEIFLEPAVEPGPNPFSTGIATTPPPAGTSTTATTAKPTTSVSGGVAGQSGTAPGLYGGTQNLAQCDPAQLVSFLEANPDKASAWVAALNTDSTLRWSGGSTLSIGDIRTYVGELTQVVLTVDTRVTNYGYENGKATPRQAVLQRGTAVLVDAYGVPRAKCACGNPLTRPVEQVSPAYVGPPWTGWDPAVVVVVQPAVIEVDVFILVNLDGDGYLERPLGTSGQDDVPIDSIDDIDTPDTTASTDPPRTAPSSTEAPTTTGEVPEDFCALVTAFQQKFAGADPESDAEIQEVLSVLRQLADAAPPEIADAMEVLVSWIEEGVASGNLDVFDPGPEVEAASAEVDAYFRDVCGVVLD